jgi:hypothetical protein
MFGTCCRSASYLGICITRSLSLCWGVSFGYLSLFAAGGGLGNSGDLGTAGGFDALGCGGTGSIFSLAQSTTHGRVGVFGLVVSGCLWSVTCCGVCRCRRGFRFGLSQQGLFANLLCSAMPQLRAVLSPRGREVAILCSMKIRPWVQDGDVFRGLGCR